MKVPDYNEKFSAVLTRLLKSNMSKHSPTIKYFAILHQSSPEALEDVAISDPDPRMRREAVLKIDNQELLFNIVQDDENFDVKKTAISRIYERKKLNILRLVGEPELQPFILDKLKYIL